MTDYWHEDTVLRARARPARVLDERRGVLGEGDAYHALLAAVFAERTRQLRAAGRRCCSARARARGRRWLAGVSEGAAAVARLDERRAARAAAALLRGGGCRARLLAPPRPPAPRRRRSAATATRAAGAPPRPCARVILSFSVERRYHAAAHAGRARRARRARGRGRGGARARRRHRCSAARRRCRRAVIGDRDLFFGRAALPIAARVATAPLAAAEPRARAGARRARAPLAGHGFATLRAAEVEAGAAVLLEGAAHDLTRTHDALLRRLLAAFVAAPRACRDIDTALAAAVGGRAASAAALRRAPQRPTAARSRPRDSPADECRSRRACPRPRAAAHRRRRARRGGPLRGRRRRRRRREPRHAARRSRVDAEPARSARARGAEAGSNGAALGAAGGKSNVAPG